jgi:dipeptidyl-peptidase-3
MTNISTSINIERFLADRAAPVCSLDVGKSFEQLRLTDPSTQWKLIVTESFHCSPREKKYAHYITLASWAGARIIQGGHRSQINVLFHSALPAGQWTQQATDLYDLLILTFSTPNATLADLQSLQRSASLSDQDWEDLIQYTAQVC